MVMRSEAMIDRWDGKIENLESKSTQREETDEQARDSEHSDLIMPMQ